MADLAVLELESPVPAGVYAAQIRCPPPAELEGLRWWAFGFPGGDWQGNTANGKLGPALGYGWVRLDSESRYLVEPGFSGGGLWCPDYDAVIAVVGEANQRGDGRAVTLHHADGFLPHEKIRILARWSIGASDEIAQAAWGWTLATDREADRHWRPRARGVMTAAEGGQRFRGRHSALRRIIAWLDQPVADRRVLVVTGSPGAGKSAVLGRIVVTSDFTFPSASDEINDDDVPRAAIGSVACAIHTKGKTALDVAREIARAASTPIPERVEDLPALLRTALTERREQPSRFTLLIDALDEASTPAQARAIAHELIVPIASGCADVGAQLLIGTRRYDSEGDLLRVLEPGITTIDLDAPEYFEVTDLAAYVVATLQLRGAAPAPEAACSKRKPRCATPRSSPAPACTRSATWPRSCPTSPGSTPWKADCEPSPATAARRPARLPLDAGRHRRTGQTGPEGASLAESSPRPPGRRPGRATAARRRRRRAGPDAMGTRPHDLEGRLTV